jgi:PAS domain S-box-containing protein
MVKKLDKTGKLNEQSQLREQARARLARSLPAGEPPRSTEELLHELHTHQIELEMQNEALRESRLELEASRDRYMDLYEFAPVGFITITAGGMISEINLTGAALLGGNRSKLLRHSFSMKISTQQRDQWHQILTSTMKHGTHPSCELALLNGDGSWLYAQLDGLHRFEDESATVVRFTLTDITERKKARAREESTSHILDSTLDMIFIFSPDSLRFEYMNKGALRETGYSREKLLQMTTLDVLPQISEAESRAFVTPLVSGDKETLRFETELLCKGGKELPVEVRLQLEREQDGGGMFVAIVRDITKRKEAERELRRQKNLMWQVIDTDPNMIFVRDMTGRYMLANRSMADFYGIPIQNLIGSCHAELVDEAQGPWDFLAGDRDVTGSMDEVVSTDHVILPDGRQHWYLTVKRPLPQNDGSINILGIAVDITDLKHSETRLAASYKKLQRLSLHLENVRAEERTKIGRNLHDEMGAVLAALKMRVAWLSSKLPQEFPRLQAEAGHLTELVSDGIRTVRQVVAELRPSLLNDIGLLEAVRDHVKKFRRDMEIECTIVPPDKPLELNESQSVTIFRIIQESLNNVAKHAHADSVEIRFKIHNGTLVVLIQDDGCGFEMATTKPHSFGLLGIRERALMIDGEATIASAPGRGTQIKLSVPLPHNAQTELDYS